MKKGIWQIIDAIHFLDWGLKDHVPCLTLPDDMLVPLKYIQILGSEEYG